MRLSSWSWTLLAWGPAAWGCAAVGAAADPVPGPVRLACNASLAAGSTLALTVKLDLSGKEPAPNAGDPYACAIRGPKDKPFATILVPANDCVLLAQGEVTLSGYLRFVVGKKSREFDCCRDGEGHGSILCSLSNMTISKGAVVSVETIDNDVVINPGGFWTGKQIIVNGSVSAALLPGQMTGVNGLLSSNRVHVGKSGAVVVTGIASTRGAAIQGDGGGMSVLIEGTVDCRRFTSGDAGGCIATGSGNLTLTDNGVVSAVDAYSTDTGIVMNGGHWLQIRGRVIASNITSDGDQGAVISADAIVMSGNASLVAEDVNATGGSSIVSCVNFTMRDNARFSGLNGWGSDAGMIGVNNAIIRDNAVVECENSYADNCGACILANTVIADNALVRATNMTSKSLGGALCGGYPGQNITVTGNASVLVQGSKSGLFGGAILAHQVALTGGSFAVHLENVTAQCGAAIATLGPKNFVGRGQVILDGTMGGTLRIVNAMEKNESLGCLNIEANLVDQTGTPVPQPCGDASGCSNALQCRCGHQKPAAMLECCDGNELYE